MLFTITARTTWKATTSATLRCSVCAVAGLSDMPPGEVASTAVMKSRSERPESSPA